MNAFMEIICFAAALICLIFLFSFKGKVLPTLLLRLCSSAVIVYLLSLFGVMPFNAIIAAATGALGAPGLVACAIIVRFL